MFARAFGSCLLTIGLCLPSFHAGASEKIEALLVRADEVRSSGPEEFQQLLARLNAVKSEATPSQLEYLQYLNAYSQGMAGKYESAISIAEKLLTTTRDIDLKARAGALAVNLYALNRQFTKGFRQLDKTLSLADKIRNPAYREQVYGVAAVVYNEAAQYGLGREYAEKVLATTTSPRARCYAGQTRLQSIQSLAGNSLDEAEFIKLIELCTELHETIVANIVRAMLARKLAADGMYDRAVDLLKQHLAEVKATGYPRLIGKFESLLSEYEHARNEDSAAEGHAKAAIASTRPLAAAYKTLYEIAEDRKDHVAALAWYRRYAEADKAFANDIKVRELAYHIVRNQSMQQAQEIELLNQKNQVLQLQQRVNAQKARFSQMLILFLLLLVGSIGYWAFKIKRVQMSLRRMAETDALTGICNRHHFSQQSEQVLRESARAGDEVALVMFDLDHFKSINDRFGHDTGDWVLKRVTDACKAFCRRIDNLGRLGGEEFAILLSGCDLRGATRVAEDCRVRIASIDSTPSGHKFVVTASFGVTATSLSAYDLAKLLSHADQMLYRAKREGRNRVCTYDGRLQPWPAVQPAVADDPDPPHVDAAAGVAPPAPGR